jgi:GT2 family glycosyltransferase
MDYGKTGIIVVNWNSPQDTIKCIASLQKLNYPNYEIILVNNGSDQIQPIQDEFPELIIHSLSMNMGFTGGYNYGMRIALDRNCDYLWLINDDLIVDSNSLTTLVKEFQGLPDAAFVGPLVMTIEQPDVILSAGGNTIKRSFYLSSIGKRFSDVALIVQQVDYISGCAILTSASVIRQIGLLYEPFFAYCEDVEWCYRARLVNLNSYIVPMAHVWHPDTRYRDENSPTVTYYINRNSLYFFAKYFGQTDVLLKLIGILRTIASWSLRSKWIHKRQQRDALFRSVIDFFFRRYGRFTEG